MLFFMLFHSNVCATCVNQITKSHNNTNTQKLKVSACKVKGLDSVFMCICGSHKPKARSIIINNNKLMHNNNNKLVT